MKKILLLVTTFFCFSNLINAQAGRLDSSFGNKGIVLTEFDNASVNIYGATGTRVLKASDGGIYLVFETGGADALITRLLANGSIDTAYGNKGHSQYVRMVANAAAIQNDGKIVIAGYKPVDNTDKTYFALARFNTDGTLDTTFSKDGVQTTDFGSSHDRASSVAVQSDGKIVAAGDSIARYNTDGSLDKSFSDDGIQSTGIIGYASSIAIDDKGKIVVSGSGSIGRFNKNGSADSTFNKNGVRTTDFDIASVAIQSDGKIVAAGKSGGDFALARYNADGTPDKTFSKDGKQLTDFGSENDFASSVAVQSNGKIIAAGSSFAGTIVDPNDSRNRINVFDFAIARYNNDGSLDSTFSQDGKQTTDYKGADDNAVSLLILNNGKIVAVGSSVKSYEPYNGLSKSYFALARYNTNGTLDTTFSADGKLTDFLHIGYTSYNSTAVQPDGKIVVVGYNKTSDTSSYILARYNTDGTLDTSFSHDGTVVTPVGEDVAIQNDGKIVVVGSISAGGTYNNFLLTRYNTNGTLDTTFSKGGIQVTDFGGFGGSASSIAIQSDGKIVAAGVAYITGSSAAFALARYNINGTPDSTFSEDGKQTTEVGGYGGGVRSIAIQNDGKIVAAGTAEVNNGSDRYDFVLARYNTDGSLDQTFGKEGKQTTDFIHENDFANSVAIQGDGKIVVAGSTGLHCSLARYNVNGTLDTTFSQDGKQIPDFGTNSESISSVAIQNNGKIVVGGHDETNFALARYNTNGSLDSSFGVNGKQVTDATEISDYINDLAISGNKLYVAGSGGRAGSVGVIARYLLDAKNQTPPTVTLTAPTNNATYLAPAAHIRLRAAAADLDGTITKVEFYNGTTLMHTETVIPYGYNWKNVPLGNYTLTAKAYDNSANVTTSAPVHISVVPNKPPVVSITAPVNNQDFTAPASIHFEAAASDTDGRITNVKFYNGTALLDIQYKFPYTYNWLNVPAGTYTIMAVATDNWGAKTTSAPVTVTVSNASIVGNKPYSENKKTTLNDVSSLRLSPNPANNFLNIYTRGLQQKKPATISIISVSGIVLKNIQINKSSTQLDVSSLASGMYTIKIITGDKVLYKQFVKL